MSNDVWLNIPVKDLARSLAFFTAIGFRPLSGPGNSADSACLSIGSKQVVLMLFAEARFSSLSGHPLADTAQGCEVLFSLGAESREQVDELARRAQAAGGTLFAPPRAANGFMYGCGLCDPDGHRWNLLYMDTPPPPA